MDGASPLSSRRTLVIEQWKYGQGERAGGARFGRVSSTDGGRTRGGRARRPVSILACPFDYPVRGRVGNPDDRDEVAAASRAGWVRAQRRWPVGAGAGGNRGDRPLPYRPAPGVDSPASLPSYWSVCTG